MCEGCKEIILEKKPVIRQAAFKHRNDFVEANDLISIIHVKFLVGKENKEGPSKLIILFHQMARNAAIDEIKEYDLSIDNPVHEKLVDEVRFNDPSSFVLVQRIMKDCSVEEKDALISIVNKEQPDEFAERYNINYANAVQKRRRAVQKVRERLFSKNMETNHG